jgi:predicted MFS family arabinose efflux permease
LAETNKPIAGAKFALFILFAINLLNFFDRQLPGALAEPIRKEFHLSDTSLGLLGTIATLMYAVVGLPLGRLADKWYRTRSLRGWAWGWEKRAVRPRGNR